MKFRLFLLTALLTSVSTAFADFEIIDACDSERSLVYRVNLKSGKAWWTTGDRWVEIKDPKSLPQSDYTFVPSITTLSVGLFRMDRVTGKSWQKFRNEWKPIRD